MRHVMISHHGSRCGELTRIAKTWQDLAGQAPNVSNMGPQRVIDEDGETGIERAVGTEALDEKGFSRDATFTIGALPGLKRVRWSSHPLPMCPFAGRKTALPVGTRTCTASITTQVGP